MDRTCGAPALGPIPVTLLLRWEQDWGAGWLSRLCSPWILGWCRALPGTQGKLEQSRGPSGPWGEKNRHSAVHHGHRPAPPCTDPGEPRIATAQGAAATPPLHPLQRGWEQGGDGTLMPAAHWMGRPLHRKDFMGNRFQPHPGQSSTRPAVSTCVMGVPLSAAPVRPAE